MGKFGLDAPALRLFVAQLSHGVGNPDFQLLRVLEDASRCALHTFGDERQFAGKRTAEGERTLAADRRQLSGEAVDVAAKTRGENENRRDRETRDTEDAAGG